jgi:16S rRNA (adenine(1408)-N(1))-methyltransferase
MEIIRGKASHGMDAATLADLVAGYRDVLIDIGAGDGRYVGHVARLDPGHLAIGVDACRENLRDTSRKAPANALFAIANALALPRELDGLAARITINFPWGSLLAGLLAGDPALLAGLGRVASPRGAVLELRLNGGALAEQGCSLEVGGARVRQALRDGGFAVGRAAPLDAAALRACPTTWARRLAHGRDPRALYLRARVPGSATAGPGQRDPIMLTCDGGGRAAHARPPPLPDGGAAQGVVVLRRWPTSSSRWGQ